MKLKNKKTNDIGVLNISNNKYQVIEYEMPLCGNSVLGEYDTLDALMQEWKDYGQHPFWYIDDYEIMCGDVGNKQNLDYSMYTEKQVEKLKAIGNYFETEEEAKKAVEKLKAWKRLKDKGARFKDWFWDKNYGTCIILGDSESDYIDDGDSQNNADLDLLFGGEE